MGEKPVGEKYMGEKSVGEKCMVEPSVGEKYMGEKGERLRVKSLWVKNLLGKIWVGGMLAFVSPFSGFRLKTAVWHLLTEDRTQMGLHK